MRKVTIEFSATGFMIYDCDEQYVIVFHEKEDYAYTFCSKLEGDDCSVITTLRKENPIEEALYLLGASDEVY